MEKLMSKLLSYFSSFRGVYFLAFIIASALLIFEYQLQINIGFQPCVMSYVARLLFLLLALLFLIFSLVSNSQSFQRFASFLCLAISLVGIYITAKHVYLQISGNTANLSFINLSKTPFLDLVRLGFSGSLDCAQIIWRELGLSLAEWTLGWFIFFAALSLFQSIRKFQKKN